MADADTPPKIISSAFRLWKAKELNEGRRITIDELVREVGLAKMTVRRFIEPSADVSGSPLSSAAAFANYFGVSIGDIVQLEVMESVGDEKAV